jgi:hypothetical protein
MRGRGRRVRYSTGQVVNYPLSLSLIDRGEGGGERWITSEQNGKGEGKARK